MEFATGRERFKRKRDQELTSCWLIAALSRTKELPSLPKLLGTPSKLQSAKEQRIALTMIFGHAGRRIEQTG